MIFHDWTATEIIPDAYAWYQYQPGASGGQVIYDSIGDKHITADVSNSPVLTTNVLNGQPGWYFNGSRDPLVYSGAADFKHAFILASNDDATFDGYQGLLTGDTSGDVLVGQDAATKFFDLGIGVSYTKSGTDYAEANQQAPMSGNFALLEIHRTAGFSLDGIKIGQQRDIAGRLWKGYFLEAILFDRVLTAAETRRVRLYFNIKFKTWQQGVPFYFPSADIVPTIGPSRFYPAPPDWKAITDDWEYEDAVKDFNEVADDAPLHFEYAFPAVPKAQLPIFDEFNNQARLVNPFYFKDPDGITWSNVRIEDYNRNHEAHKRWRHDVAFRLVGYNSTATPEPVPVPPTPPTDLVLTVLSDSSIMAEWGLVLDITAPSVPTMSAGSVVSDTEIDWAWSAATDDTAVTGYDLQVATNAGFTTGLTTYNLGNVLVYSSTGLVASTTYYARVRAHDAAPNNSAYSSSVNATTDAAPGWTPADLPDIKHWYKASSLALSDNDPVSTWVDDFGTADATSSGSARPTYKANSGDPYVEFDGTDDVLAATTAGGWLDLAGVVIVDVLSSSDNERVIDLTNVVVEVFTAGNIQFSVIGSGPARAMAARPTGFFALYFERDGTSGKIRLNGAETTGAVGTNTSSIPLKIGEYTGGGFNGNMRIKEIILCDNNLSGGDFTLLAAYISAEYGLTL